MPRIHKLKFNFPNNCFFFPWHNKIRYSKGEAQRKKKTYCFLKCLINNLRQDVITLGEAFMLNFGDSLVQWIKLGLSSDDLQHVTGAGLMDTGPHA